MLSLTESDMTGLKLDDPNPDYTWVCSALTLQTKKEGFFKDYAEQVESSLNPASLNKFSRLTTDEARLRFCLALKSTHCLDPKPFFRAKCTADAAGLRAQAELFLNVGNPKAALQLLSRSVTRAPAPGTEEDGGQNILARSLAARAQALLQLGRYELALRDTQCALSAGMPQATPRCRLLEVQGQCYEALGQMLRAKLAYVSASKLIDTTLPENQHWSNQLIEASKRCESQILKEQQMPVKKHTPEVTGGQCEDIPNASRLLAISQGPDLGRYVTACEPINTGDTLVVEPAYGACLLTEKAGTHCHHCFQRLEAPIGCPVCSGVAFCSPDCQAEACETYHKVECRFINLFIGSGMSVLCHLALRLITRAGSAEKFLHLWRTAHQGVSKKSKKQGNSVEQESEEEKYRRFLQLVGHDGQRTTRDFLHRSLMAIFLLKCLQEANFFKNVTATGAELSLSENQVCQALLKHLQILQFNAHEVSETLARSPTQIKGSRTQYLGVAIYISVALFNHDCYPAVSRTFRGTKIIIQALRPLQSGQVVAENYGPIFTKRTKAERQKSLRSRYWFVCQCQACNEDWPGYDKGMQCQIKDVALSSLFDLSISTMDSGNIDEAIILLSDFISVAHKETALPDRNICLAMDALRLCLAARWGTVFIPEVKDKPPQNKSDESVQIAELVE